MPRQMSGRSRPANRPGQARGGRRGQLEAFERRAAESAAATASRAAQAGLIELPSVVSVADLGTLLGVPAPQIIKTLLNNGTFATINAALDYDTAAVVATDLGFGDQQDRFQQRVQTFLGARRDRNGLNFATVLGDDDA